MRKPEHPDFPVDPETGGPALPPDEVGSDVDHRVIPDTPPFTEAFAEAFKRDVLTKLDGPDDLLKHDDIARTVEEFGLEGDVNAYLELGSESSYRLAAKVITENQYEVS